MRPVNRLKENISFQSKPLWIALAACGFSKNSIVTFVLILFGFLSISATLSIPSEATPLIHEAGTAIQDASLAYECPPVILANCSPEQESNALSFSCNDEFNEQEDSLSEGEEKNKRFAVRPKALPGSKAFFSDQSPNLRHFQSRNIVALVSPHGNQLQLYNSGDEPDSSIPTYFRQTFLRPPHINKGGLFHALRANRHHVLLFRHHSRHIKTTKQFSGGSASTRANQTTAERRLQDIALQPTHAANPVKRWLLYRALLL